MSGDWQKDYPLLAAELTEADLDENSSLKKMLRLVGENKRVIDFGCATGYLARFLTTRGCQVTGLEINPEAAKVAEQYCQQVIVADLDYVALPEILPEQAFDVAVFGDVLEHLRNPWRMLAETQKLLKPDGYVVASIPNVAHGNIRLALLQGRFEYVEQGLLDSTHLRFFTSITVKELFEQSGYFVDRVERTKLPMFAASPWIPYVDKHAIDPGVVAQIEQDEEADTFQFVLRAFPLSLEGKYTALNAKYSQLVEELERSQSHQQQLQTELESWQTQQQQTQVALEQAQLQQQQSQAELERAQVQIQHVQTEIHLANSQLHITHSELHEANTKLHQTQTELWEVTAQLKQAQSKLEKTQFHLQEVLQNAQAEQEKIQSQLQEKQAELEYFQSHLQQAQVKLEQTEVELQQAQTTITAMQASKFWKLRIQWFKIKPGVKF